MLKFLLHRVHIQIPLTDLKMSFKAIDFPSPKSNSGSCTAFSGNVSLESYHKEQFLSLRLLRLIFLKNTDQLFCRTSFNLPLSDGLSCLNSGCTFFVGMSQSNIGSFAHISKAARG